MSGVIDSGVVESAPVETAPIGADPEAEAGATAEVETEFKAIVLDSQEAADNFMKSRVARAKRSAEQAAQAQIDQLKAQVETFETEKLTETEKVIKRAEAAEKLAQERADELTKVRRDKLVSDLASTAKLPRNLWDRVRGDSEEDIQADITVLAAGLPAPKEDDVSTDSRPPVQKPTVKVTATGGEPETTPTAKSVVDSISLGLTF